MNEYKSEFRMKSYSPLEIEQKWQKKWRELEAFNANVGSGGDPFCIVIPPPNVTGSLHMGHAFNTALIDVIVRFQRLAGKNVLCLPGTDHASIAVQTILEKQIKEDGLAKEDIGREKFLERAWAWKEKSGGQIISQLKSLGYSVDWSRERFTLDQKLNDAVVEAFLILHKKGLIYRGEYLVNWCPASQSAVSDLEVEMREIDGNLWHFKYPLIDEDGSSSSHYLEVATTRPETLLGDAAVAVNPLDKRYQNFIGKKVRVPFVDRDIPVVGDSHVEMEFGTGCVKVTPAHDMNDFEIGKRNNLEQINIMNKDGSLNENAGKFQNLDRYEARKQIISELDSIGLLTKIEEYKHTVPFSERGKVPIEPLLSTQWFLKMDKISKDCLEENNFEKPNFIPKRWQKVYKDWLVNINDWCISRQLWWGHQIPAWYVLKKPNEKINQNTPYIIARNEKDALKSAAENFGAEFRIVRDKDVLDTWFSSGLWPFSTLGWPNVNDEDFKKWYPNSVMVTGFDIIFFWVARMTMMGNLFTSKIPFNDVYIHGLVRDENNKKMSKTAGNGIDPLLLINNYGSDALRFALVREVAGAGQDIRLDFDRKKKSSSTVEASRNFANKLWNATKFVLLNCTFSKVELKGFNYEDNDLDLTDKWILSKLDKTKKELSNLLNNYKLGEAAKLIYEFVWNDFCDWYLEFLKIRFNNPEFQNRILSESLATEILDNILVMMNPFMPHLTEELWHSLHHENEDTFLSLQRWPSLEEKYLDNNLEKSFEKLFEIIRIIRNLRAELGLKPTQNIPVILVSDDIKLLEFINKLSEDIRLITKSSSINILKEREFSKQDFAKSFSGIIGNLEVFLPFEGLINLESLKAKLVKDQLKVNEDIKVLNNRILNENFIKRAPKEIVDECKSKLKEAKSNSLSISKKLEMLS